MTRSEAEKARHLLDAYYLATRLRKRIDDDIASLEEKQIGIEKLTKELTAISGKSLQYYLNNAAEIARVLVDKKSDFNHVVYEQKDQRYFIGGKLVSKEAFNAHRNGVDKMEDRTRYYVEGNLVDRHEYNNSLSSDKHKELEPVFST